MPTQSSRNRVPNPMNTEATAAISSSLNNSRVNLLEVTWRESSNIEYDDKNDD